MYGRVSYETLAIRPLYIYSKSHVAKMKHRRTTVASIFQNGIPQNTRCDNLVGPRDSSHIYTLYMTQTKKKVLDWILVLAYIYYHLLVTIMLAKPY